MRTIANPGVGIPGGQRLSSGIIVALLTPLLLLLSCSSEDKAERKREKPLPPIIRIDVTNATFCVGYSAQIAPARQRIINSKASGFVTEIKVREGDVAQTDEVILRIEERKGKGKEPFTATETKIHTDAELSTKLAQAEKNEAAMKKLLDQGIISQAEYLRAAGDYRKLKSKRDEMERERGGDFTGSSYKPGTPGGKTSITAPIGGVILRIYADVGSYVANGQPIVSMEERYTDRFLTAFITDKDPIRPTRGGEALITVPQLSGEPLRTEISEVSEQPAGEKKIFRVSIRLPKPDSGSKSSQNATAEAKSGRLGRMIFPVKNEPRLLIPVEAVRTAQGQSSVIVVDRDGKARVTTVKTGETYRRLKIDNRVYLIAPGDAPPTDEPRAIVTEALAGISSGDSLFSAYPDDVAEGERIFSK